MKKRGFIWSAFVASFLIMICGIAYIGFFMDKDTADASSDNSIRSSLENLQDQNDELLSEVDELNKLVAQLFITMAKADLHIGLNDNISVNSIVSDITLPTTLESHNVTITWASSNPAVTSTTGVVTRQMTESVTVTLTATITFNGTAISDTKIFTMTVKSIADVVIDSVESFETAMAEQADGQIWFIAAGEYPIQVNLNKNVTIIGEGSDKVSITGPSTYNSELLKSVSYGSNSVRGIVNIANCDVSISGITIAADPIRALNGNVAWGGSDHKYSGIGGVNANITLDDVTITGLNRVAGSPGNYEVIYGSQNGFGIYTIATDYASATGVAYELNLNNCTIQEFAKGGVIAYMSKNAHVTVTDSTFIGFGDSNNISQNGLQISCPATVTNNDFIGFTSYGQDGTFSGAVLIYMPGVLYDVAENFTFENNRFHKAWLYIKQYSDPVDYGKTVVTTSMSPTEMSVAFDKDATTTNGIEIEQGDFMYLRDTFTTVSFGINVTNMVAGNFFYLTIATNDSNDTHVQDYMIAVAFNGTKYFVTYTHNSNSNGYDWIISNGVEFSTLTSISFYFAEDYSRLVLRANGNNVGGTGGSSFELPVADASVELRYLWLCVSNVDIEITNLKLTK